MDERTQQLRVGIVVVTATIISVLLVLFFGEKRTLFQQHKTVYMKFDNAPGASQETPVRKNGVLVGRVTNVELLDEGGVLITARINSKYKIRRNEGVIIRTGSIIGDAVLEFVPNRTALSSDEIEDAEFIANTAVANDPVQVLVNLETKVGGAIDKLEGAGDKIVEVGTKLSLLADNLNSAFENNTDQFQRIVQKTELSMDRFGHAMETLDEVIGDPQLKADLKRTLRDLPQLFEESRLTLGDARNSLQAFQKMNERADRNLQNLEKFTTPLADRGEQLVETVLSVAVNVDRLFADLSQFGAALNQREGTLGQLIYERDIYDSLLRSAKNIEEESRKLRPILDDVRIFTDKISRDPREIGLKGALDRRPLGAGTKHTIDAGGE